MHKSVPWHASCTVPTAIRHPNYLDQQINHSPVEIIDFAGLDPRVSLSKEWPAFNNIVSSRSLMPIVTKE